MATVARKQTAFRLKDSLLEKLKWNARKAGKSVNHYVEDILEASVGMELTFPRLDETFFERAGELERFAVQGAALPEAYQGKDASGQAAVDREILTQALREKYGQSVH